MRTAVQREQEETDSEITLSATTLLGIFFGLVLICGVFFGFGYSTGRRNNDASNANSTSKALDSLTPPASHTPKPSAMESLKADTTSAPDPNTVTESLDQDSTPDPAPTQPAAPAVKPAAAGQTPATAPPTSTPAPVTKPVSLPTPVSGGSYMVQIAAVTRSEDANALASALRQHGYSVVVRNEPQDQLLHVQVGPFATRDDAKLMRTKLLGDGYNAILKP
jgi:cell division septation protein DedD